MRSRVSWAESPFDTVVVFFVVAIFGATGTAATVAVVTREDEPVVCVHEEVDRVHVVVVSMETLSWYSSASVSKSSSSSVISNKAHVCDNSVPVISMIVHVRGAVSPLRENSVPIVELEDNLRSYKSCLAHWGLIRR